MNQQELECEKSTLREIGNNPIFICLQMECNFSLEQEVPRKKCHLQVHQGLVAKVLSEPVDVGVVEVPHGHGALRVELLHGLSVDSGLPVSHRDHVGHQVVGAHVAVNVLPKQGRKGKAVK